MTKQNSMLRSTLRKKRRQCSVYQQRYVEHQAFRQLIRQPEFLHAQKVGLYLSAFGEVQTHLLIEYCFQKNKQVFLPMICNMNQHLVWVSINQNQYRNRRFAHHALGMREPMTSRGFHVGHLDLLIMPLLACDRLGTRMGMGGGFYDRTLASAPHRPFRLGLAHQFQFLNEELNKNNWDQGLDALQTEQHFYRFRRHFSQS
ncbi:5-formyltetrahydrofolate cyclo-ligase [Acinetobacter gerneri]|uniref:5-formyltetrahydrofolate cyclo-ligase n=1 Tax=Acinetobacter gerneri TaxID=202952 RepID=UPI0028B2402B|nr:5-formyltetrahydrofolate cyclo-ligase [Acinetobacter gerneri]